jgi:hypothetical protein
MARQQARAWHDDQAQLPNVTFSHRLLDVAMIFQRGQGLSVDPNSVRPTVDSLRPDG